MARRSKMISSVKEVVDSRQDVSASISFDEAVERFLDSLTIRGLRPATSLWHRRNLLDFKRTLEMQGVAIELSQISKETLTRQYVQFCIEERHLDPVTINGRITTLRQIFHWLYDEGLVTKNPAVKLVKMRSDEKEPSTLSRSQVKMLLSIPDRRTFVGLRDYTMMMVFVECGLRLKEIRQLEIDDLNMADRTMLIRGPKSRRDRRVPFQSEVAKAINTWLAVRGEIVNEDHVFVSHNDDILTSKGVQDRIKLYGKEAGITKVRVSPHTFRHTMARLYIENGGDPFSLQQILGHADQDMVSHYVKFWGKELIRQHAKFSPIASLSRA